MTCLPAPGHVSYPGMRPRNASHVHASLVLAALCLFEPAYASTQRYVLNPGSVIAAVCSACDAHAGAPEPLTGSFDVTVLPTADFGGAAVTNVRLTSQTYSVVGNGFLQR